MISAARTWRSALFAGGLGAAAVLGGCEKENDYGYVQVTVKVAENASSDFLRSIASCGVNVIDSSGAILDFSSINCQEGRVTSHQLGVVDWSTVEGGSVRFVVTLKNRATCEIGKGTSANLAVVKNGTVTGAMQVEPLTDPTMAGACPGTPGADGGAAGDTAATDTR